MSLHYSTYSKRPTYTQDDAANALYALLEVLSDIHVKALSEELRVIARHVEFDAETFEKMVGTSYYTDADEELEKEESAHDYYLSMQDQED